MAVFPNAPNGTGIFTVLEKLMANRPYILVYKDPLLTCLLVSVPSILTLRYLHFPLNVAMFHLSCR